uniref:Uncharacterized protein n=1 Tax=Knipowitschia caucasica TaxID=637954 RepID=A0AAV2JNH9_KNICA
MHQAPTGQKRGKQVAAQREEGRGTNPAGKHQPRDLPADDGGGANQRRINTPGSRTASQKHSSPGPDACLHGSGRRGGRGKRLRRTGRGMRPAAGVVKRKGQPGQPGLRTATASRGSRERNVRAVSGPQRCRAYSVCG